jgi:hypothetical protein
LGTGGALAVAGWTANRSIEIETGSLLGEREVEIMCDRGLSCIATGFACIWAIAGPGKQVSNDHDRAIAAIRAADGTVHLDNSASPGFVMAVHFKARTTDEDLLLLRSVPEVAILSINGALKITDDGLAPVSKLGNLNNLVICSCFVGDAGMEHLKGLTKLAYIDLANTQVTGKGLVKLAGLKNLAGLNLNKTNIGDADLALVVHWPRLRELNLVGTKVTDVGLAQLKASKSLDRLNLAQTGVTDAGRGSASPVA